MLCTVKWVKKSPAVESSTWPLNSHNSSENSPNICRHGGASGSALTCGACKSCQRPGFESHVQLVSQFKKSQTAVSTTERHFTLSVGCLIVECTKDRVRVTKKTFRQLQAGLAGNGSKGLSCNYYFLNKKQNYYLIKKYAKKIKSKLVLSP